MTPNFKTYEASVKLSNGSVVQYHNINTGLIKFHKFICSKFDGHDRWISYSVRRKVNKEIIGNYQNSIPAKINKNITIFTQTKENDKGTGVFIPIIFSRNNFEIVRNMFVSNKLIINRNTVLITIPEWLFEKIIYNGRVALFDYYIEKKHQILLSEIKLGNLFYTTEIEHIDEIPVTEPKADYP